MNQQSDYAPTNVEVEPPAEDGWYTYNGGAQIMIFRLTRGQWYVILDNGTMEPCVWGYIEQALGVYDLVPLVPKSMMDGDVMEMANGHSAPKRCVKALEEFENEWPGATFHTARAAIAHRVLKAYHTPEI